MQIYQLEQFYVLAQCEHMTLAAQTLHITQSALSQSISRLEDELGVKLFDRYGRRIRINAYGREFMIRTENIFRELDDGKKQLDDMRAAGGNRIHIADLTTPFFTGGLLRRFLKQSPDTAVEYQIDRPQQALRDLRSGSSDLLFSTNRIEDPELFTDRLGKLRLALLIPTESPFAKYESISIAECQSMKFIGTDRFSELRRLFESVCFDAHFFPRYVFESNDSSLMTGFAHRHGAAIVTLQGVSKNLRPDDDFDTEAMGLKHVVLDADYTLPNLYMTRLKAHYIPKCINDFLDSLQSCTEAADI